MKYYILAVLSYFSLAQDTYTINLVIENKSEKVISFDSTLFKTKTHHQCKKESTCTFTWKNEIPFHVNIEKIRCDEKQCKSNDPDIKFIKLHSRLNPQNGTLTVSNHTDNIAFKEIPTDSEMQPQE